MKHRGYDVVVVGGGHAGCEAALAAERLGARTALITHRFDRIGEMSCNPAIGGIGKGHIVREIDALGGMMARAADYAGIQFRLLNRKKGPAAHGPRTQADRARYREAVQSIIRSRDIAVIEGEVVDLRVEAGSASGVELHDGSGVFARSVVLTTGTFLHGVIHIGKERREAGRLGDPAAIRLAERIADLGLALGRLKTGTPPRLDGRSIDWAAVEMQPGDAEPDMLSFLSERPMARQIACGITHSNQQTHDLVAQNITSSAVYGGAISGPGPRYCPSIEDKVVRFPDKASHQIFLEPESLNDDTVYPNGISTSLPPDIQIALIRSIRGLENARVLRHGYAIEYDYVDPRGLDGALAVKGLGGFYLAGQINGTTGYEEAAGQGLVAGLNAAAHALGRESIVLDRSQAFIGVMIDDLITKGVSEPYRMFTSRAEYRLQLRADNADQRLTPLGIRLGCVSADRQAAFEAKLTEIVRARSRAAETWLQPEACAALGLSAGPDRTRSALAALATSGVTAFTLKKAVPELGDISTAALTHVSNDAIYAPYIARQAQDIERLRRDEAVALPESLDYPCLAGLSKELQDKLHRVRPATLGQAARIEGMTPAALTLILLRARQAERQ